MPVNFTSLDKVFDIYRTSTVVILERYLKFKTTNVSKKNNNYPKIASKKPCNKGFFEMSNWNCFLFPTKMDNFISGVQYIFDWKIT